MRVADEASLGKTSHAAQKMSTLFYARERAHARVCILNFPILMLVLR